MSPNPFLTLSTHPSPPLFPYYFLLGFPDAEYACNDTGDTGLIPGSGRSPEEGMATHSSILAWRIPWAGKSGRLQSKGSQRVRHDWTTKCILLEWHIKSPALYWGRSFFWYPDIILRTAEGPAQYFRKSATRWFPWGRASPLSLQTPGPGSSQSALTLLSTLYNPLPFIHLLFLALPSISHCQHKSMLHGLMLKVWKIWKGIIECIIKSNVGITAANVHS